jgi:hypothetical protein
VAKDRPLAFSDGVIAIIAASNERSGAAEPIPGTSSARPSREQLGRRGDRN